jgi:hypothetical protein
MDAGKQGFTCLKLVEGNPPGSFKIIAIRDKKL